jgi:hypothetical protein
VELDDECPFRGVVMPRLAFIVGWGAKTFLDLHLRHAN